MSKTQYPVFTIGHSNHSLEYFIKLLRARGVDEVVDIRSAPYSRYRPWFNRDSNHDSNYVPLKDALENEGIDYLFMGGELGGRPADRFCYDDNGRVMYDRFAKTDAFNNGVKALIRNAYERCIALMCSEKEPLECHRSLLVAHNLAQRGVVVQHILTNGNLESHDEAMNRLLEIFKMLPPQGDMFPPSRDERNKLIADAVERRAKRFAFVDDRMKAQHGD